ncbi:MAG: stage II sporulation protein D [Oscillospiraceae bacterium]|jgi:stage II sporulation protein D|nr:stage II sporulation protein D [Oscillospiraceae bacterium]
MRKIYFISMLLIAAVFIMPIFAVKGEPLITKSRAISTLRTLSESTYAMALSSESQGKSPLAPPSSDGGITVKVQFADGVRELRLYDYLCGVVSAEMPASFPPEALKAQAVAARTHTYNRILAGGESSTHGLADVCTDPAHCKAYAPPGENGYPEAVINSVAQTDGLVVLSEDEPILAVFHAASSGKTERAADVWGGDVPYLQSVVSDGEEAAPRYRGEVCVTREEFAETIKARYGDADFDKPAADWFSSVTRSEAGGVISLEVCGTVITGNVFRSLFGLNSTNFEIETDGDNIRLSTTGYGHGVGMSQYGARALALEGKSFEEILTWYYTGASVGTFTLEG